MITLVPYAGLANRIRCVCSVHKFCMDNNVPFKLCWPLEKCFNAEFKKLFKTENLKFEVNDKGTWNRFLFLLPNVKYSLAKLAGKSLVYTRLLPPPQVTQENKSYADIRMLDLTRNNIIVSYSILYDRTPVNELFVPVDSIQAIIDDITRTFSPNTIGVHIRRTDHTIAKNASSVESFDKKISELIATNLDLKVFLCTDDVDVKNFFIEKYGNRILYYESVLNRNSYEGIRDAVVELWTLARTREIYGSYGSSFSKMAANIYGKPYYEVRNEK